MSRPKKTSAKPQPAESTPKPQPAESTPKPQPAESAPAPQPVENAPKTSESSRGNELEQMIQNRVEKALSEKIQLEAYIKSETRAATNSVYKFIGVILGAISLAGFLCWDKILDHVSTKTVAKVATDVAATETRKLIQNQVAGIISNSVPGIVGDVVPDMIKTAVPGMIDESVPEIIKAAVPGMIEKSVPGMIKTAVPDMIAQAVPEMIRREVEESERHLKDVTAKIDTKFVRLENDEKSLAEKYQKAEAKLSFVPIMAEARAGNRISYDKLVQAIKENPDLTDFITPAINEVNAQYKEWKFIQYHYGVTLKHHGSPKLKMDDYVNIINGDYEWNCNGAINDLVATGKKEFVATLVRAVKNSKRLDSVYLAIAGIEKLTNKSFPPIGIDEVLQWWKTASTTAEYHSPYEYFCDLRHEFATNSLTQTDQIALCSYLSRFSELQDKYPDYTTISEFILTVAAYSKFRKCIICSTNECFYKKALDITQRTPFGKTDKWYCFKALNDKYLGGLDEGINERLKASPSFEKVLKDSGMFNSSLFESKEINWPSKAKRISPIPVAKKTPPQTVPQPEGIKTQVQGYVTVHLKKGKQLLSLPFVRDDGVKREKLGSKSEAAREGDVISWTIDQHTYNYTFSNGQWYDEDDKKADDVEIPVGQCGILYERVENEETDMAFAGTLLM